MVFKWKPMRLFRKLVFALWISMILTIAGTASYFYFAGLAPPTQENVARIAGLPVTKVVPLAAAGVATLITGMALAWYLVRPLQHLSWALRQVAQGRLDTRVHPRMGRRNDEIADLAQDFDRMAAQLQQLTESRKVLLHDISHELRSPLTRIQAAIGLMRQDGSQAEQMIERIGRESERLDELIEELLTLHRLEADTRQAGFERVDIIEILQAIAEDADFEARTRGRSVRMESSGSFVCAVNGELIYRAFENVIRNAVKFTVEGSQVEIQCRNDADSSALEIRVLDRGPGVPADKMDAIFQPFTRLEAGDASSHGVGLGLAIARRAIERHGGTVMASLREGGGLAVRMILPAQA